MAGTYSDAAVADLKSEAAQVRGKYEALTLGYTRYSYTTERGREFGQNGFARRVQIMSRCIEVIFEHL
jgi:hypothetical protein